MPWQNLRADVEDMFSRMSVFDVMEINPHEAAHAGIFDLSRTTGWQITDAPGGDTRDELFYKQLGRKRALARTGTTEEEFAARRLEVIRLHNEGLSHAKVAEKVGMTRNGVKYALLRSGIKGKKR